MSLKDASIRKKKQGRITQIAILIAIGFHVVLYLVFRATGVDKVIADKIVEIVQAAAAPPPPPPPPPPPKTSMNAPPPVDMSKFSVQSAMARLDAKNDFDASMLNSFGSGGDAIDLAPQAMDMSGSDMNMMVSNAQLATITLGNILPGFDISSSGASEGKKGSAAGYGKRTAGKVPLAVLDIRGDSKDNPWRDAEIENIAEYISSNTSVKAELGARAISFVDQYSSFQNWVNDAKGRAPVNPTRPMSDKDPEIDALTFIAGALPYIADKDYEKVKTRVRKIMADYFNTRFKVKLSPEKGEWVKTVESTVPLQDYQKQEYMPDAEKSFMQFFNSNAPSGNELRGLYNYLRVSEIMQLPILFCDPRGVPEVIQPENERFLRTYINNGGFIYFLMGESNDTSKTPLLAKCMGIRGIITSLIQEKIDDPVGKKTLLELQKTDKEISGYVFRDPDPAIFHPFTFFPMILPRQTNVSISIFNKIGNTVYTDTLKNMIPGAYLQKNRHYKWFAVDNQSNEVESGYYIYKINSDLCQKTGPLRVSRLRKLPNGKHGVFSAFFNISEVPKKETPKSSDLPYGELGVYGVMNKGRMVICYTEGYKEKEALGKTTKDAAASEAALKWVTNVIIYAMSEGSLAR